MNRKHLLAIGLLSLAATAGATDAPRQNFECDTPAGHFSYWNRTVSGGAISVAGKLVVNELRPDGKWGPTALVILEGGEDGKSRFGIRLYAIAKLPDTYFIELVKAGGNEKLGLGVISSTKEPIPFSISIAANQLRVSLAGIASTASLGDFKPAKLELSCSTGDFEFKDFTVEEPAGG